MGSKVFKACVVSAICAGLFCLPAAMCCLVASVVPVARAFPESPPSPQEILCDEAKKLLHAYWREHGSFPESLKELSFTYREGTSYLDLDKLKYELKYGSTITTYRLWVINPDGSTREMGQGGCGSASFHCYDHLDPSTDRSPENSD